MPAYTLYTWIARHIGIRPRLERVCVHYLLFLMVAPPNIPLKKRHGFLVSTSRNSQSS